MKTYFVVIDVDAQLEALDAADFIARDSREAAEKWLAGLQQAMSSLDHLPGRCGLAREAETVGIDLRQYIYHSHRVIFRIEEESSTVRVLHVRHAAQRAIGETDDPPED